MMVTVAICTWNRSNLLDQTLREMAKLVIPEGIEWEIVVVDNNSTDDTAAVIARHTPALPIRGVFEPAQGHSHARNRAVAEANGDLIVWTDDDVLVEPRWLAEYVEASRRCPDAAFFGGRVDPWFAVDPPRWIEENLRDLSNVYAICQHGDEDRPLGRQENPVGASMAFRAEDLRRYRFDPEFGRLGRELRGNDEVDVLERLRATGRRGAWVASARLKHYIPAERLTSRYVWEWFRWDGRLAARRDGLAEGPLLWGAPRWVWRKYLEAQLRSWISAPAKGPGWFRNFLDSARWRGAIDESRASRRMARANRDSPDPSAIDRDRPVVGARPQGD